MTTKGSKQREERDQQDVTLEMVNVRESPPEDEVEGIFDEPNKYVVVCAHCIVPGSEEKDFLGTYRWCPPPISMLILSIIQLVFFIIYAVELESQGTPITALTGVPQYSPFIYKSDRRYEVWRFITYMFIHIGYIHLISNLIIQMVLGVPLEWAHSWWRVPILYIIGVITGSLAHSMTDHNVNLAGASGGGYALVGAHLAAIIVNWKEMNYKCWDGNFCRMLMSAPVRLSLILSTALSDIGLAIYRRYAEEDTQKIGISAHIGGLLAGLLIGVPLLRNIKVFKWEKILGWVTLSVYIALVIVAILFNGLYKGYPPTDWSPCCP